MTTAASLASYTSSLPNFRNKIINGGMQIAQRGTSFTFAHDNSSAKPRNGYHLDRFAIYLHNTDEYECTVSQYSMTSAEINTTGHTKALKLLTVDAESSGIANDEYARITYRPEAKDIQDFLHGTASAKTITLSFWTKSSVAGTFGFNLYRYVSSGTARSINLSYTINAINTWEHKTIQIPGDTGGNLAPNDTTAGFILIWQLASGSDRYSTAATSWGDYATTRLMGNHSDAVITTASADWYLTGVQLEIGTVATPFEHRPIGMELSLCKRYFENLGLTYSGHWGGVKGPQMATSIYFDVEKRATPDVDDAVTRNADSGATATVVAQAITTRKAHYYLGTVGGSNGHSVHVYATNGINVDAEL